MRKLIAILLLAVGLALASPAAFLWVRSYWKSDFIQYRTYTGADNIPFTLYVCTGKGGLGFGAAHNQRLESQKPGFAWTSGRAAGYARGGWTARSQWHQLGFSASSFGGPGYWIGATAPGWFCTFAPLLPPSVIAVRWFTRTRRRRRRGLCLQCGYDLRASTGACPECGTIPAPSPT